MYVMTNNFFRFIQIFFHSPTIALNDPGSKNASPRMGRFKFTGRSLGVGWNFILANKGRLSRKTSLPDKTTTRYLTYPHHPT